MDIIKYPDEKLRETSKEVKFPLSKEDKELLDNLYSYVKVNTDIAAGISAIQVGVAKRMCAIRTIIGDKLYNYKLVNPKIVRHSAKKYYLEEGCLSVDEEHHELVGRYDEIMVVAYDAIQNKNITIHTSGWLSRVLQHEIDHMDGILFIDRIEK